jgi:site-specific recombinase XerD
MDKLSFTTKFYADDNNIIYLRITVNRKKAEISTKRTINPKKWDANSQKAKGDPELNSYLLHIQNEVTKIHSKLISDGKEVTAKLIKDIYLGKDEKSVTLISYLNDHIREIAQLTTQYKPTTIKRYETIQRHLEEFLAIIHKEDIKLNNVDLKIISQFDHFLKTKKKISTNTAAKYLTLLKGVFLKALRHETITRNPFANFVFKTTEVTKEFLTKDELEKIETLKLENTSINNVRDTFLLSAFTGLRFSDAYQLKISDLKKENDGQYWITIKKVIKTGKPLRIPVLQKALNVIEKHKKYAEVTGRLMPIISNQKTNAYLKILADMAGIEKKLTHHCARHTFATTVTLSNKVPIEVVSNLLGHSNLKSTQIYAKITDQYLKSMTHSLNKKLK